ncbi:MAG: hypothetical protein V4543_16425 [Bacteroidota bacterium]
MRKLLKFIGFGIQMASAFVVFMCIFMSLALLDYQSGIDGLLSILVFQPVMGAIFSLPILLLCLVVGLPLRFVQGLNYWWRTHFYLSFFGILIGTAIVVLACLPGFTETFTVVREGVDVSEQHPDTYLSISGTVTAVFFTMHQYLPRQLTEILKTRFNIPV